MIAADRQEFQMKDLLPQFAPSSEQPIRFLNYDSRILIWNLSQWIPLTLYYFGHVAITHAHTKCHMMMSRDRKIHSVSFSCYIILSASILEDFQF